MEIYDFDPYFGKLLPVKQHKSYTTAVSVATMTFQDAGNFGFEVI